MKWIRENFLEIIRETILKDVGVSSSQGFTKLTMAASMCAIAVLSSIPAEAYIPQSSTIAGRVARNNGRGLYVVEQEVRFRTASDPVIVRERWVVENGENMRLTVTSGKGGDSTRFEALYRDGRRTAPDFQGGLQTSALSPEFLETFFHARSGRGFLGALVRSRIAPQAIMRDKNKFTNLAQVKYEPEPYVRLGRTSGVIAWVFGEPTPAGQAKLNPGIWVEQDMFDVRRLRFPTEAEVTAERYNVYASTMRFPRERTITWGDNSAVIRVVSIKPIKPAQAKVTEQPNAKSVTLPDLTQVREFYSRFR